LDVELRVSVMVLFLDVCKLCDELASISSRSAMVALVSRFIRDLEPDDLELAVRFIVEELFPPWEPEIGLGVMGIVDSVIRVFSSENFLSKGYFSVMRRFKTRSV